VVAWLPPFLIFSYFFKTSDYGDFQAGEIAFVKRNNLDCSIFEKVMMASSQGASGIVIWTDANFGLFTKGGEINHEK
jgi:hypothetical protein